MVPSKKWIGNMFKDYASDISLCSGVYTTYFDYPLRYTLLVYLRPIVYALNSTS